MLETITIIQKYKGGKSLKTIAKEHYTYDAKIRNILTENNVPIRTARKRPPGHWQMMINDWNAGVPIEQIVQTYGYKHANSARSAISKKKQEGYYVVDRTHQK